MDTINHSPTLTIEERKQVFSKYFSSGSTTSGDINKKFELLNLLCYVTFQLKKRFPDKFNTTLDVIEDQIEERTLNDQNHYDRYLIGTSIICDDFLELIYEYPNNTNTKNFAEAKQKIKNLLSEWMPF